MTLLALSVCPFISRINCFLGQDMLFLEDNQQWGGVMWRNANRRVITTSKFIIFHYLTASPNILILLYHSSSHFYLFINEHLIHRNHLKLHLTSGDTIIDAINSHSLSNVSCFSLFKLIIEKKKKQFGKLLRNYKKRHPPSWGLSHGRKLHL